MKIWNKGKEKRTKCFCDAHALAIALTTGCKAPSMMEANFTRPPTPSMKRPNKLSKSLPEKNPSEIADSHNLDLEQWPKKRHREI